MKKDKLKEEMLKCKECKVISLHNPKHPICNFHQGKLSQRKEDIEMFIEELIKSKKKYGLDWCETLFIEHIKKELK